MRGSGVAVEATALVCVLAMLTAIITIGYGLPHDSPPPPPKSRPPASLRPADDDVVTSQTRHEVRGDPVVSTDVIEEQREGDTDEKKAEAWLQQYDQNVSLKTYEDQEISWAYATNITDENKQKKVDSNLEIAKWKQQKAEEANKFDWKNFQNDSLKRQFRFVTDIGTAAMKNESKLKELKAVESEMLGIYSTGSVSLDGKDLELNPDLEDIMATSRNYSRLLEVWEGWRNAVGRPLKSLYQRFVNYSNEAIRDLGHKDTGEYWRSYYESETFREDLQTLLDQLSPLYKQLHAYVRGRLRKHYGKDKFPQSGHIPAHLLGDMWAQRWNNIYDLVLPYPNRKTINVTAEMKRQNYTVTLMFKKAEEFFKSLKFDSLLPSFWNKSVLEKPTDRKIDCHGSAWDFGTRDDFRIKMCTSINHKDLVTVHHEMGHIQYGMQYSHQPFVFRDGANPGFHEAVGDTISLSVDTPVHLKKIGLLKKDDDNNDNNEDEINFLMMMALDKVAFLPFGYLIDQWRWSVFAGDTQPEDYNHKWWQLRCQYQGIYPPVSRSAEDFDPGAKYHIPKNTPYIRYFVAFVLQFQFQQALCKAAGYTGKLNQCDIYNSEPAGERFRTMLSKGKSIPWPDVLEAMTGSRNMNASALLDYFQPLHVWLEGWNNRTHECVGWSASCPEDNWNVTADFVFSVN